MLGPGRGISWGLQSTTAAAAAADDDDDVTLSLFPTVVFTVFDVGFITSLHPETVNWVSK